MKGGYGDEIDYFHKIRDSNLILNYTKANIKFDGPHRARG